mgnify:FL=1
MDQIMKSARLLKAEATEEDLALIARQALRPLAAEEIYTFRLAACNNQVDRDLERFTEPTLEALAKLFVGRPVLLDHKWSAGSQTARVYGAGVEEMPGVEGGQQLVLRCYMPRLQGNGDTLAAIETGLLRECSVGVEMERAVCAICGTDRTSAWCEHVKGREYEGKLCYIELDGAADAYEVSLLPVPAQSAAGVVKRYGGPDGPEESPPGGAPGEDSRNWQDDALLELEKNRYYGGNQA